MTATIEARITIQDLCEYIGHHIRTHRTRMGLSQQDLGYLVERRVDTVCRWETGTTAPSLQDLLKVAHVLGQPIGAFLPRGDR